MHRRVDAGDPVDERTQELGQRSEVVARIEPYAVSSVDRHVVPPLLDPMRGSSGCTDAAAGEVGRAQVEKHRAFFHPTGR